MKLAEIHFDLTDEEWTAIRSRLGHSNRRAWLTQQLQGRPDLQDLVNVRGSQVWYDFDHQAVKVRFP